MGPTLRRNKKDTIGNAWEKGLGKTEWMELAKWKWAFPEAAGCWSVWLEWKWNEVSGVSVRNERSSWKGMERKWKSYTASTWINKQLNVFYFLHNWWVVGKSWGLRAAERGKNVDICAAIIHNGVIGFFIGFIPSWKLKKPMNYMLCIIALSFFSGASAARW